MISKQSHKALGSPYIHNKHSVRFLKGALNFIAPGDELLLQSAWLGQLYMYILVYLHGGRVQKRNGVRFSTQTGLKYITKMKKLQMENQRFLKIREIRVIRDNPRFRQLQKEGTHATSCLVVL